MIIIIKLCVFIVPEAPRSLTADRATDTTVTLSWMEPNVPNGIIINYQIEYRVASSTQSYDSQNTTSLNYTVAGLSSNTEYEFRVAAATRVGFGDPTDSIFNFTASKFKDYVAILCIQKHMHILCM